MKESDLKQLGFKKVRVSAKESGSNPYYYYKYEFNKSAWQFVLLSNANDELKNGEWYVRMLGYDFKKIKDKSLIRRYIKLIKDLT
jgi:hypothetical protein